MITAADFVDQACPDCGVTWCGRLSRDGLCGNNCRAIRAETMEEAAPEQPINLQVREIHERNQAVTDGANAAFDAQLKRSLADPSPSMVEKAAEVFGNGVPW